MDPSTEQLIPRLPKAELHLHLEGSVSAATVRQLARKYGSDLSSLTLQEVKDKLFAYEDFPGFLESFKVVCHHLREAEDYTGVLDSLAGNLIEQNVRYAEILFTPSVLWKFGYDAEEVLSALLDRSRQIEAEKPLMIRWILDCVRQFGPEPAMRTARLARDTQARGVVAVGLGGDEQSLPMSDYEEVFAWARANALFAHVHAGETGGPDQIWNALKILGANRIGHGIQAARDPELMDYLRDHAVGLDICLTSNARTKAWPILSENPFWLLHKRGVPVTLNTDDPELFQTSLNEEYRLASRSFDLGPGDLRYIAMQGIRASFLPHADKMALMQKFQDEIHEVMGP